MSLTASKLTDPPALCWLSSIKRSSVVLYPRAAAERTPWPRHLTPQDGDVLFGPRAKELARTPSTFNVPSA